MGRHLRALRERSPLGPSAGDGTEPAVDGDP